jgi:GT2 family glycosyltransferase
MTAISISTDISVIICAYTEDRWQDIVDAVDSVQRQTVTARDIILVIDHNPKLFERARNYFQTILVIENTENKGVSGARNSGVAIAQGSILCFLDDDAKASPDWLARLQEGHDDKQVLGVGGGIDPNWVSQQPDWFPPEFNWAVGATYKGMSEKPAAVRNVWSGNMTVRREVFEAVGGFHKDFSKVGTLSTPEDTEFCIRVLQNHPGGIWLFKPDARILHKVPVNRTTWKFFTWRCFNEGMGKAKLANLVGMQNGLSSEVSHTVRTLPISVIKDVINGIRHRDKSSFMQAGAIVAGFTMVASGYVVGASSIKTKKWSAKLPHFKASTSQS